MWIKVVHKECITLLNSNNIATISETMDNIYRVLIRTNGEEYHYHFSQKQDTRKFILDIQQLLEGISSVTTPEYTMEII